MNKINLIAAASICGLSFLAAPSMAQPRVEFGIDQNGRPRVGVDDDRERYDRREYWRQRRDDDRARAYEEGRREAWRDRRYRRYGDDDTYGERCRTIIVREENEWGRLVTRRIRRCG
jgi:hypothetical protein